MGGKNSKVPSVAEQRRALQLQTIQFGLTAAGKPVHFENLVFEGSGNKAVSYYGALKVLQELGLLTSMRRFAGVGAGAGWAMLLAIGLSPTEIADLNLDNELSYHANFGMFAMMPNLAQKLGWSPLGRAVKIVQRVLEQRSGKTELTFKEVLEVFGRELCIVATNLTTGSLEYFHPKTTPDVPIVDALVMSATLPGIMKPKYLMRGGKKHYFVDGGVLCNYAIHAFDGWYLSMKKEDSFLSRLSGNLEPPFKGYNDKTLGIVTVSPGEGDFGEEEFLQRLQYELVERPNTKLARSKGPESESRYQRSVVQGQVQGAGQRLLERLRNANLSGESQITVEDFQRALGEGTGSNGVDDIQLLFGKTREELTAIFEQMNTEREGKVTFDEFMEVAQQQNGTFRQHLELGGTTRNIRNMPDIFRAVLSAVEGNSKRAYLKEIDIIRSIGVNTDYVGSLDPLGSNDKNFLVVQGEAASLAFLLDYTQKFAPAQVQMPIYSALPQRQMSTRESIIDPDEMATYTVPHNLYPTLPPSYESAIGDSDYLRDTLETNWPQPAGNEEAGRGYNYEPEKQPLPDNQLYPQIQASGSDPWGIPQSTTAAVTRPQHTVTLSLPADPGRPEPDQVLVQDTPAHAMPVQQQNTSVFIAAASSEPPPHCANTNSQIHLQPSTGNPGQFTVSIGQPPLAPQQVAFARSGGAASSSAVQFHQQEPAKKQKQKQKDSGGKKTKNGGVRFQQIQQPQLVAQQQPIVMNRAGVRFQQPTQAVHQLQEPIRQYSYPKTQHPQTVLVHSPVLQRRTQPIMLAPTQGAAVHGQPQHHLVLQPQQAQNRRQRQLTAVQNQNGEVSHFVLVS